MIRRGKAEGWLHLSVNAVKPWAEISGVDFTVTEPALIPARGLCLLATQDLTSNATNAVEILSVAEDLVLSRESIMQHAKVDRDLREVLESLGDFGLSPRASILTFLLFQASMSCPDIAEKLGVRCTFTDYVKTLPSEMLPTFWTSEELGLLVGTTLAPAMSAKLKSLHREYDLLCELTSSTRWFGIVQPHLDFDDWLQVDAMFRSRALEFYGSCMVPGLDIASHASGNETNSYYERRDGACVLYLLGDKEVKKGDEITITYGDEKGACEMIFSYGFLEDKMDTAETLFLSLSIPDTDHARSVKLKTAGCAPGFKIIDIEEDSDSPQRGAGDVGRGNTTNAIHSADGEHTHPTGAAGEIDWTGDYVWFMCVTEEDGLQFEIVETTDGKEETRVMFNGQRLQRGAAELRRLLAQEALWDVYRLRALVILQQRVLDQLQVLYEQQDGIEAIERGEGSPIRDQPFRLAMKLRQLEFELLDKACNAFEAQKYHLAESDVVKRYLAEVNQEDGEAMDESTS